MTPVFVGKGIWESTENRAWRMVAKGVANGHGHRGIVQIRIRDPVSARCDRVANTIAEQIREDLELCEWP